MRTLFFKTLFAFIAALIIFLVFLSLFLFLGFDRSITSWSRDKLQEIGEQVEEILLDPDLIAEADFPQNIPVFIYNAGQELIYSNRGEGRRRSFAEDDNIHRVHVDGRLVGYYHVGNITFMNDTSNQQFIHSMTRVLWIGALTSCVIAIMYAFFFSRSLAGPAKTVVAGIRRIAGGDLENAIPEGGAEEISRIAGAANELREQLLRERLLRTQWAEDIAHDLRTPVSALRAQFEGMLDGVLSMDKARIERNIGEIYRVEKLINDLQELMGLENPERNPEKNVVALDDVIANIATTFAFDAKRKNISIQAEATELELMVDEDLLLRALSNVMTNALRHTDSGGIIELSARDTVSGVALAVRNTGDIIPEDEIGKVFDRLFRGDRARNSSGTGLGLTIARRIVELHNGTITISSTEETGTVVTFNLPR